MNNKFEELKKLKDSICNDYRKCKGCPFCLIISPYTFENVCIMIDNIVDKQLKEAN